MSISTYAELQTAIARRINDSTLTSIIPDFIASAEVDINTRLAIDPVRPMGASATGTISAETLAYPATMIRPKTLEISDGSSVWRVPFFDEDSLSDLQPLQYDTSALLFGVPAPGPIMGYTMVGSDFRFFPVPSTSYNYVLKYWQKVPALSVSATTNWLLTAHHTAYLYGSLAHACVDTQDYELVEGFRDAFNTAMDGVVSAYPTATDSTPFRNDLPLLDGNAGTFR